MEKGLLRYNYKFDNYVVIIGCDEQTANIVKLSLKRQDVDYVLIQTRQDVEAMRMKLDLSLDREEEKRWCSIMRSARRGRILRNCI